MKKGRLIYVYDALCGWCYGFSPVMMKIFERYQSELEFEVISGGMMLGDRVGPIGQVAPYIKKAYKEVENRTGVQFGAGFLNGVLEEGTAVVDSLPPARALSAAKQMAPDQAVPFAHRLQKAIYHEGIQPTDEQAYHRVAEEFGLEAAEFAQRMQSEEVAELARLDFALSSQLQVTGFPCVFFTRDGQEFFLLAKGHTDHESLQARLQSVLGE